MYVCNYDYNGCDHIFWPCYNDMISIMTQKLLWSIDTAYFHGHNIGVIIAFRQWLLHVQSGKCIWNSCLQNGDHFSSLHVLRGNPQTIDKHGWIQCSCWCPGAQAPVASFTKEVNWRLAKRPLVFNGLLAKSPVNFLSKRDHRQSVSTVLAKYSLY